MDAQRLNHYLTTVAAQLQSEGFRPRPGTSGEESQTQYFHRRRFRPTRLSLVDTVCAVRVFDQISPQEFVDFSGSVFAAALAGKSRAPRGLGGMVVAHAIAVTETAGEGTIERARSYVPKHWAAAEFPGLVELERLAVHCYEGTPVWGAAYYRSYRDAVKRVFTPY
jgi:hypothetical protein